VPESRRLKAEPHTHRFFLNSLPCLEPLQSELPWLVPEVLPAASSVSSTITRSTSPSQTVAARSSPSVLVPLALFAAAAMVRVEAAPVAHSAKKALLASAASLAVLSPAPQPEAADLAEQQIAENQQVNDFSCGGEEQPMPSPAPVPEPESQGAALPEIAAALPVPSLFRVAAVAPAAAAAAESDGSSLSFDRTLTVSGEPS
jgi:hypothetical protein